MKFRSVIFTCVSALSLLSATHTFAENRAGAFTATIGGGTLYFDSKRDMENTGVGLIGLGYDFTDRWGIEGLLGSFHTHFRSYVQDDRTIDGTLFAIDGVYHVAPFLPHFNFVEPYVLAGVGVLGMNPSGNDAHNQGNINAGVGVEFFIHPSIAFRLEARDFYTIVGAKNDAMLDAGITFFMGGCPTGPVCRA